MYSMDVTCYILMQSATCFVWRSVFWLVRYFRLQRNTWCNDCTQRKSHAMMSHSRHAYTWGNCRHHDESVQHSPHSRMFGLLSNQSHAQQAILQVRAPATQQYYYSIAFMYTRTHTLKLYHYIITHYIFTSYSKCMWCA